MKKLLKSNVLTIGLAIFSMFFGAGNLMYPIAVGMESGSKTAIGMLGFLVTAVFLPLAGLLGMILFDGNYQAFFNRLGRIPGSFLIFASMVIIGPLIAIPRIVTLSHTMIAPFMPIALLQEINPLSSFIFCLVFLGVTFLATYKENNIIGLLGNVISPLLLISLVIIIVKGIFDAQTIVTSTQSGLAIFEENLRRGYETLDLLGAIFFSSIILAILKNTMGPEYESNPKLRAMTGLKAGAIGLTLLGLVYIGMSMLGAYHGHGLVVVNSGELFREIAFKVVGNGGALIIGTAVLMACLSTSIALSAVIAEYLQHEIFRNKVGYVPSLVISLLLCIPLSTAGLTEVLKLTAGPIIYIGYPVIIVLTLANIAYKAFGFKPIKMPVALTFVLSTIAYYTL